MTQERNSSNQSERTIAEAAPSEFKAGPFVAVVRNHLDSKYMGSLEVELLTSSGSGNSTNSPGQTVPVSYLSPFYGTTPYEGTTDNEGHQFSQRSYGMWFVPPDIGSKVLVIFAEGGQGFWIGCVMEDYMNFMLPGNGTTTFNSQDDTAKLPVTEYNKKVEDAAGRNATKFIKPVDQDALDVLKTQGLDKDNTRGLTTSSARRELPSTVFGVSSPGPQDRREGSPRVRYGEEFASGIVAHNRLGGSSLVFDDGDPSILRKTPAGGTDGGPPIYVNAEAGDEGGDPTLLHNELVRLKTRTGHQILMHNTEDLIYIANSRGTAWIELSSNGKVDIYAASDVSIHSEADMNFKADGSMYFEAGADIHMKAGANIFQTSTANIELKAGADGKITTAANLDFYSGGDTRSNAANTHWTAGSHTTKGTIEQNGPEPTAATESVEADPAQRVPEHEPWDGHENLHTDAGEEETHPDTFRQSTTRSADQSSSVQPPEAQAEIPGSEETTTAAQTSGVLRSPGQESLSSASSSITSTMRDGIAAISQGITVPNVSQLTSSVDFGSIRFPAAQELVREIDNVVSSSQLRQNIENVAGTITQEVQNASNRLLNFRTRLARVNTS